MVFHRPGGVRTWELPLHSLPGCSPPGRARWLHPQALLPGTAGLGLELPRGAPPVFRRGAQPQCAQDFPWFSRTLAF